MIQPDPYGEALKKYEDSEESFKLAYRDYKSASITASALIILAKSVLVLAAAVRQKDHPA